jgi:phosphatidylglycerol lysyltransferase
VTRPRRRSRLSTARRLLGLAKEGAPPVFAALAFAAGLLMLVSSVTPAFSERLVALTQVTPTVILDLSHFLASIVGFLLLVVAGGLWRRRRGAYYAALALLVGGAVFTLLKGLNYEEAAMLLAVALALAPCKSAFDRPSRLGGASLSTGSLVAAVAMVCAALWLGVFSYSGDGAERDELWLTVVRDAELPRFLRAGAGLAAVALVFALFVLLSGPRARWHGRPAAADVARAVELVRSARAARAEAWLAALGDKDLLFSDSGRSLVAFRARGGLWIAMGEPAGDPAEFSDLLWRFAEEADRAGARPVLYAVSEELLPTVVAMGMTVRKIGETAIVPLDAFNLTGRSKQDLRTARNRAEREGLTFAVLPPGSASTIADELRRVSDAWLDDVGGREKGFSLGRFDPAWLDLHPVAVVRDGDGRAVAFANLMTAEAPRSVAVDLMRFEPDAPPVLMDFLFTEALLWAQANGWKTFDLGMTPLAGLPDRRLAPAFARVGAFVFEEGEGLYGFQGLRAYKSKFSPDWRPVFMAAGPGANMGRALLEVGVLTSGGWGAVLRDFLRLR